MKFLCPQYKPHVTPVVPHAGTWIEIALVLKITMENSVVPHAGTWIEITLSKPGEAADAVVPHAGTWIEIKIALTDI